MKKIIVHTCVTAGSLLLALGAAVAGPLSPNAGMTATKPPLATLVRQGADHLVKHKRHGRGLDDGPGHVRHSSSSFSSASSSSSRGRGSDDGASHEHHGGDDHGGDHHGGGGGDDHGGRR
ncbi:MULTISPECIES: hypothetical protein [unclassified Rhizobium]|uniref:hypothetical protein n=1 Tax=unclassified Rhizobium TaxID=2613769 RepID=UPI001AD9D3E9|nr:MULTISPECIES: hypothetical protein [unclassified Rhizobium]MBO9127161.1 hypothetical protein [Rhizobium sp. 16-488-2b]MBO9177608.1 hypothetical protein [Rhizobium sp. 16-488-2a]